MSSFLNQLPPDLQNSLMPLDEVKASGVLHEANRLFFHPIGLQLLALQSGEVPLMLVVQDLRGEPEKAVLPAVDKTKVGNIEAARKETAVVRQEKLGYDVQR